LSLLLLFGDDVNYGADALNIALSENATKRDGIIFLTTAGRAFAVTAINGEATTFFDSTNALIGVGDGSTAFSPSQTDMQGSNKLWKAMDPGYPQRSGNQITFQATFDTDEANFDWNEWGIGNGSIMLTRMVQDHGVKSSSRKRVLRRTIEVALP